MNIKKMKEQNSDNVIKTGVVDVGGGMRDIYGCGVFDRFMERGICFDYCVGVSAGSANISSFMSHQKGRNYKFYMEYSFRPQYMSFGNWLRTDNYLDLDYIYGTLSNSDGEDPMDFEAAVANPAEFKIVATNALTGRPHYFDMKDMKQDDYGAIKASCCVPVVNRPYMVGGIPYYDGGFSDPIPFRMCAEAGCGRIVIIITRPKDFRRDPAKDNLSYKLLKHRYPESAEAIRKRAEMYNAQLDEAVQLEKEGKVMILAPDDVMDMKTLTRDRDKMEKLYQKGMKDAEKAVIWLSEIIK